MRSGRTPPRRLGERAGLGEGSRERDCGAAGGLVNSFGRGVRSGCQTRPRRPATRIVSPGTGAPVESSHSSPPPAWCAAANSPNEKRSPALFGLLLPPVDCPQPTSGSCNSGDGWVALSSKRDHTLRLVDAICERGCGSLLLLGKSWETFPGCRRAATNAGLEIRAARISTRGRRQPSRLSRPAVISVDVVTARVAEVDLVTADGSRLRPAPQLKRRL